MADSAPQAITAESYDASQKVEKAKLIDLNTRFRRYVSDQAKKSRDYEKMIKQLGHVEKDFETKMHDKNYSLRQMHETQQSYKHAKNGVISEQKNRAVAARLVCDEFFAKNRNLEADNNLLAARKSEIEADLSRTSDKLDVTTDAVNGCTTELNAKTVKVSSMNADLSSAKGSHNELKIRQSKCDNALKDTKEKLRRYDDETQQNIVALQTELLQRAEAERRIEAELREEYQGKLQEFMNQRRLSHESEKGEWMKLFRDEYHRKITAYRNANEHYESKISQLRVDRSNLQDKIADLDIKIEDINRDITKFSAESGRWQAQVGESKSKLEGLRTRLGRKSSDFHAMLLVKNNLENEITDYFNIIHGEEDRMGLVRRRS